MAAIRIGILALLATSALYGAGNPAATEEGTVERFKQTMGARLLQWEDKIAQLREKAESSGKSKEKRLLTSVRDLQSHSDRIKDEMSRMSENETPLNNQAAEASIDRHFREMDKLFAKLR